MKATIITGVSGGMGYAAARQLSGEGYIIFGLDRKEPAPMKGLHYIRTDLTDADSVHAAFRTIQAQMKKLAVDENAALTGSIASNESFEPSDGTDSAEDIEDIHPVKCIDSIIHLAGMYDLNSLVEISEEDFAKIFQINLFAVYRVNKTFLPLLKDGGRIIITTSELAPLDPLPFTGLYAITKTALEKYAASLRMELQLLGHQVVILRPGAVDTRLLDASVSALNAFCSSTRLYPCNADKFRNIVNQIEARNIPPEKIAGMISKALSSRHPRLVYQINRNPLLLLMNLLPARLQGWLIRKLI